MIRAMPLSGKPSYRPGVVNRDHGAAMTTTENQTSFNFSAYQPKKKCLSPRIPKSMVPHLRTIHASFPLDPTAALYELLSAYRTYSRLPKNRIPSKMQKTSVVLAAEVESWLEEHPTALLAVRSWCNRISRNPFDRSATLLARSLHDHLSHMAYAA